MTCKRAIVLSVAVVLGLFGGCTRNVGKLGGDEPPIRVRNGSMKFELLGQAAAFEEDNSTDKKKWRIKTEPSRERNKFLVVIVSGNSSCNGIVRSGNDIDIVYSTDNQEVEFKSNGNKTKITANPKELKQDPNTLHTLEYGVSGSTTEYIKGIRIDSNTEYVCEFSGPDPALQIFLLD